MNDMLPKRIAPLWVDRGNQNYFDGCIRDEMQARRAYRYTLTQSERNRQCRDWRNDPNTRMGIELERAIKRALELKSFLSGIPYPRYERRG